MIREIAMKLKRTQRTVFPLYFEFGIQFRMVFSPKNYTSLIKEIVYLFLYEFFLRLEKLTLNKASLMRKYQQ